MEPIFRQSKYAPELRERAVRMVFDHGREHPSQRATIRSVAEKLGRTVEVLRRCGRRAERGTRPGLTTGERRRLKQLRHRYLGLSGVGAFSCTVSLVAGRNSIVVTAVDLAGNSTSAGFRANRLTPPTSISVTPSTVAMAVGDERVLSITTESGLPAAGVTLESSDPDVIAVDAEHAGTITGAALGIATVTATLGNLSAETVVRVLPGGVAIGEAIWTAPTTPGHYSQAILLANPVLDNDPDLFNIGADGSASSAVLCAEKLWPIR